MWEFDTCVKFGHTCISMGGHLAVSTKTVDWAGIPSWPAQMPALNELANS